MIAAIESSIFALRGIHPLQNNTKFNRKSFFLLHIIKVLDITKSFFSSYNTIYLIE